MGICYVVIIILPAHLTNPVQFRNTLCVSSFTADSEGRRVLRGIRTANDTLAGRY